MSTLTIWMIWSYLAHEEERCAIAAHGYGRACDLFSYHTQLTHMLTVFAAESKDC